MARSYTRSVRLEDYLTTDATGLAALVADKQVTPAELLALARQRADQVNPKINHNSSRPPLSGIGTTQHLAATSASFLPAL
jgi:hypothetical protein